MGLTTMNNTDRGHKAEAGFTLVELMITILITILLTAAIYAANVIQQRVNTAQSQVAEAQQNIRAAFFFTTKDLRMAGFDPTGSGNAGIVSATAGRVVFTQDITDDPGTGDPDGDIDDPGEYLDFGFPIAIDADDNGIPDAVGSAAELGVQYGDPALGPTGHLPIAENIERIQFLYILDDGTETTTPTAFEIDDIVAVTISILARTGQADHTYVDNVIFTMADGPPLVARNDSFRRRLLMTTVICRNMGI